MSANISEEVLTSKRQGLSEEERLRERVRPGVRARTNYGHFVLKISLGSARHDLG